MKIAFFEVEDWQKDLLLMKAQGTRYSEISKIINKPENQLKVYYHRLKSRIMNNMEKHVPNHE